MKTTWGIAAALLLVAAAAMDTSARGRGGKHGFHGHGKKSGHKVSLVDQLGLSEDQQTQIQTLRDTLHEQGQALGEQYWTDVEALLTAEQRETLEEIKNPLGLSEDQQTQIQALKDQDLTKEEFRTSFEAILTDEQRETLEELKANRGRHNQLGLSEDQQTQIQALKDQDLTKEEFRTSFEAILTDEQLQTLEELKANRGNRGKHKVSLVDQLGLSEDQQTQIEALGETLNEQRQVLREQYWTDFEAILTADQLATLEAVKANRGCHWKDSEEEAETTETEAAGKVTTVAETSWGRVKDSFGQ